MRALRHFFINLWLWRKIIWSDRQWDHAFFFRVLEHKLKLMEDFFDSKSAYALGSKELAQKIKVERLLCERVLRDDYCDLEYQHHKDKYGELTLSSDPSDRGKPSARIIFSYSKCGTAQEYKDASRAQMKICKQEEYLLKQDIAYLFKRLTRHIQMYWD